MSGLKLRNIRKAYCALEVIKGVSLEIEHKELWCSLAHPVAENRHCCA